MWQALTIGLAAGIAATPHCLGMCGGFPLHLAKASRDRHALLRQLLFVLGKTLTYMFLGSLAAALGAVLLRDTPLKLAGPTLRILAGTITVVFGAAMLGIRLPSFKPLQRISDTPIVRSLFGSLLVTPTPAAALVLGLGVGFLPCPLPMAMLALAVAHHHVPFAILLMAGVGLGTAPGLLGVGLFGIGLDRRFRRVGMRAAGVVVILIGLLTLGRATNLIPKTHTVDSVVPPCCQHEKN